MGYDPYPPFTESDMDWFRKQTEQIARKKKHIENVGRRRAGLDLELVIVVSDKSRDRFPAEVCKELARKVAARTGVAAPVVYVYGDPHLEARESLRYAANQG